MRKALGKGIDALITRVQENDKKNEEVIKKISILNIIPNKYQPRKDFDEESIKELANSIKKHGLAQPILVSEIENDKYEIIAGERRFRACKNLGLNEISAIIKKTDEEKKLSIALIENLQREDLNPIEEAIAYKKLMTDYSMNQNEIAEYCGKSKYAVSNTIRLLELEDEILEAIRNKNITEGHARALLSLPDKEERKRVFHRILTEKLNVRDVENVSRKFSPEIQKRIRKTTRKSADILNIEKEIETTLGTKVEINSGNNPATGKIVIHYYSIEDFDKIMRKLKS